MKTVERMSIMGKMKIEEYFGENAQFWLDDAYLDHGYNYTVGFHRLRIVLDVLLRNGNPKKDSLLDIGCGGGNLCLEVARRGYKADGVDSSPQMIQKARNDASKLPSSVASKVHFYLKDFSLIDECFLKRSYDFITALGFIGYLENDEVFFKKAQYLLKRKGILVVSFRNRLFNMFPGSRYLRQEIRNGSAESLLDEIEEIYENVSKVDIVAFCKSMNELTSLLLQSESLSIEDLEEGRDTKKPTVVSEVEARQHTPSQVKKLAENSGFVVEGLWGVHPHWVAPQIKHILPSGVYNKISDVLCVWESSMLSLIWSSVFLVMLRKK